MAEPTVEYKRKRLTTISMLEARVTRGEAAAKTMLHRLEEAMVRCGYLRDGIYNSRNPNDSHLRQPRSTVLHWKGGKILLGTGVNRIKGGGYEPNPLIPVARMHGHDLVRVASHLAPFLDALEGHARHLLKALEDATATIRSLIDRIEADPMPSDEPAQHDEAG
jgi:hypothetical protein